jgi:hypothetical protein
MLGVSRIHSACKRASHARVTGDDAVLENPVLLANPCKAVQLVVHGHAVNFAVRCVLPW